MGGTDLQEVQAGIIGDTLYIASNYNSKSGKSLVNLPDFYDYNDVRYRDGKIINIAGPLHAEQQILAKLAEKLQSGASISQAVIIGSKPPCSTCRRVLLAFSAALKEKYPEVKLYFSNRTGDRTDPDKVGTLTLEAGSRNRKYEEFVKEYGRALAEGLKVRFADEMESREEKKDKAREPHEMSLILGAEAPELGSLTKTKSGAAAAATATAGGAAAAAPVATAATV